MSPSLYTRSMTLPISCHRTLIVRSHGGRAFSKHVELAYALHVPTDVRIDIKHKPLIIAHGLFGSKQNNRSISIALAQRLKTAVYAIDLRNHGDSPHHQLHTYDAMADDVKSFIESHALERPTLIGHSMGAKVAMTVALRCPRLVRRLISVDNAPVVARLESGFHNYVRGLQEIEDRKVMTHREADSILSRYEPALPVRQFLLTNLNRNGQIPRLRLPVKVIASSLDHMGDFPYKHPEEVHYNGPTLFIRGNRSPYIPDDVLPVIGRYFPRFVLEEVKSGHWVISENPTDFLHAVLEFLQQKDAAQISTA